MLLDYKEQKLLSEEQKSQKEIEYAVKSTKLQYQANLLATQSALDEAKKKLSDLKCAYPFDFEEVISTADEVESLKKGLDTLKSLGKELGFE